MASSSSGGERGRVAGRRYSTWVCSERGSEEQEEEVEEEEDVVVVGGREVERKWRRESDRTMGGICMRWERYVVRCCAISEGGEVGDMVSGSRGRMAERSRSISLPSSVRSWASSSRKFARERLRAWPRFRSSDSRSCEMPGDASAGAVPTDTSSSVKIESSATEVRSDIMDLWLLLLMLLEGPLFFIRMMNFGSSVSTSAWIGGGDISVLSMLTLFIF
mmetsp:Transcript_38251/g.46683  ORF Transcript_38251/g.46683 Transcript_38251/m.46683 type:complete len:219 (-) Transcript_38251:15-671(-)